MFLNHQWLHHKLSSAWKGLVEGRNTNRNLALHFCAVLPGHSEASFHRAVRCLGDQKVIEISCISGRNSTTTT